MDSDQDPLPDIHQHTTVNELADCLKDLQQSITMRIYDESNEVIGAIRLVSVAELQQIEQLQKQPKTQLH